MITISIFSVVILIIIIHTLLSHLLNWLFRELMNDELVIIPVFLLIIEFVALVFTLKYYIK